MLFLTLKHEILDPKVLNLEELLKVDIRKLTIFNKIGTQQLRLYYYKDVLRAVLSQLTSPFVVALQHIWERQRGRERMRVCK